MKSRIAILSLLLTGAAISASAQTKEHYSVWVWEHRDV